MSASYINYKNCFYNMGWTLNVMQLNSYRHPQLKYCRYSGSYFQAAAVLQPKKKVNLWSKTASMMNFWKKSTKLPGNLQKTLVTTVITLWSLMAVPHDSTLAPFLIGMDFLVDRCFVDDSFTALGRNLR